MESLVTLVQAGHSNRSQALSWLSERMANKISLWLDCDTYVILPRRTCYRRYAEEFASVVMT